ncbi:MAG: methylenetetrahydrofolate reductase [Spirochaetes bacterium]|nr:methylenetetrahydrofolate reductase [Spirochaetota bacterium]
MNSLIKKIQNKQKGILLYGLTPPKMQNSREKNLELSKKRLERIKNVNIDGLVIYDIQDEVSRTKETRPFPFLPTLEPMDYYQNYLSGLEVSPVIYQCISKYPLADIDQRILKQNNLCTVFVGAPSRTEQVLTTLNQAYQYYQQSSPVIPLGGVLISERHQTKGDEHLRIAGKQQKGCRFFISQCVYHAENFKNILSDYYYHCLENQLDMVPLIMTVSPCGSQKTVDLFKWLGIHIPRWIENDLKHSQDILASSMTLCKQVVEEMLDFCLAKNIPFGCNVESISIKRDEVLASFQLVKEVEAIFKKAGLR